MKKAATIFFIIATFSYLYCNQTIKDMSKLRNFVGLPAIQLLPNPETGKLVTEQWKEIPNEQDYFVSNYGRVLSTKKRNGQLILIPALSKGYYMVGLWNKSKSTSYLIHRLVGQMFIHNPKKLPWINHLDLVKTNNFVFNLEWCTPLENSHHAYRMGIGELTVHRGMDHGMAKLTDIDVLKIRELYKTTIKSQRRLAKMFGVARNAIRLVVYNKTWTHV